MFQYYHSFDTVSILKSYDTKNRYRNIIVNSCPVNVKSCKYPSTSMFFEYLKNDISCLSMSNIVEKCHFMDKKYYRKTPINIDVSTCDTSHFENKKNHRKTR